MKVLVLGGVAAGTKVAAKLMREDRNNEVIVLNKGKNISYAGCGLPYYIGHVIEDKEQLIVNTPEKYSKLTGVKVLTETEATKVDSQAKTVTAVDVNTGAETVYDYDKLVISVGASPVKPPIEGCDLENVFLEEEKTYYLVQLHKELDVLEEKILKFTVPEYDKLKLDFQRISNLNYLMPSEKVFTSRKFWLDFFDIEKIIYDEEKKMDKKVKARKSKNNLVDNKSIISALNKSKLVIEVKESDNNCKKFINWVKKIYIDSKEFGYDF